MAIEVMPENSENVNSDNPWAKAMEGMQDKMGENPEQVEIGEESSEDSHEVDYGKLNEIITNGFKDQFNKLLDNAEDLLRMIEKLNKEKGDLKQALTTTRAAGLKVLSRNEQLKTENDMLKASIQGEEPEKYGNMISENEQLKRENEQLKQENERLKEENEGLKTSNGEQQKDDDAFVIYSNNS